MRSGRRYLVGLLLELRLLPVTMWSFTALALGTAIGASEAGALHAGRFGAAAAIGALVQGLVAHCVNDVADWRSGTDRHPSARTITGGSKVLPLGLLTERQLTGIGSVAAVAACVLGVTLAWHVGWELLIFGGVGLAGAAAYTLAPARAAYRPLIGELVAFACMAACVLGAARLQSPEIPGVAVAVATIHAAACVTMLMVHHLPDRVADLAADPPKRTTPALLGPRHAAYATAWGTVSAATAIGLVIAAGAPYWPLALGALATLIAATSTVRDTPRRVLLAELAMIAAVVSGGLATATALEPGLAWTLIVPAAVVVTDLWAVRAAGRLADPVPHGPSG